MINESNLSKLNGRLFHNLGNLAGEFRRTACDTTKFLALRTKLPQLWTQQQLYWNNILEKLPVEKMAHSKWSEYNGRKVAAFLETTAGQRRAVLDGLRKCWMPLPSTAILFPMFRYLHFDLTRVSLFEKRIF